MLFPHHTLHTLNCLVTKISSSCRLVDEVFDLVLLFGRLNSFQQQPENQAQESKPGQDQWGKLSEHKVRLTDNITSFRGCQKIKSRRC